MFLLLLLYPRRGWGRYFLNFKLFKLFKLPNLPQVNFAGEGTLTEYVDAGGGGGGDADALEGVVFDGSVGVEVGDDVFDA